MTAVLLCPTTLGLFWPWLARMWQCRDGTFCVAGPSEICCDSDFWMYILGRMGPAPITTVLLILLFFYEWFFHLCKIAVTILFSHMM